MLLWWVRWKCYILSWKLEHIFSLCYVFCWDINFMSHTSHMSQTDTTPSSALPLGSPPLTASWTIGLWWLMGYRALCYTSVSCPALRCNHTWWNTPHMHSCVDEMLIKQTLPLYSALAAKPRNTHTHTHMQIHIPRRIFGSICSITTRLYLLTEEVMKENHTKPEVVMTEEKRGGGARGDGKWD